MKRFIFAFNGLTSLIKSDKNFRLHLFLFIIVIIVSFYFQISKTEWAIVLICSGLVLALEAINSALEVLCNKVTEEIHPSIKYVKDVSASAVLIFSFFSIVIASIIFIPKILNVLAFNN